MPLLIDTYNVLHTTGVLPPDLAGIGLAGLVELISRSRYGQEIVYLVCDGTPKGPAPGDADGRVRVRYAGPGRDADDVIARMVRQSSAPRRLTVISSDRAVGRAARRRRCRTLTSEQFLTLLARDAEQPPRPPARPLVTDIDVDEWMKAFDIDAEHLELPPVEPPEPAPQRAADRSPDSPPTLPAAPREPELPPDVIGEAEALEAEWLAALEPASGEGADPDEPDSRAPAASDAAAPATPDPADSTNAERDDGPIIPRSVLEEAEGLLRRDDSPESRSG
jgi:hypothetical protein